MDIPDPREYDTFEDYADADLVLHIAAGREDICGQCDDEQNPCGRCVQRHARRIGKSMAESAAEARAGI